MNDPISTRDIDVTHYRNLQDQPLKKTKGGKRDTKGGKKLDKTQESTSDKQPKEIIIPKGDKSKFSYHGFMDRHYECRGPGIRRMEYTKKDFDVILRDVYKIFKNEPVLIDVAPPYTIVGDVSDARSNRKRPLRLVIDCFRSTASSTISSTFSPSWERLPPGATSS